MKTLTVHLTAELQVPDDWTLVDHASGVTVLKVGDQFIDFDITPLSTREDDPEALWSDDDQTLTSQVLDCVTELDTDIEIAYHQ
ncbi:MULTISPECIES: hypothetical protein [unclassified Methyloversatilis]|jgi:hypothetical protein|uniref:hypothetical protein n=1 Tax=unclassified Methyloversatilis TaxID=2639971 RepID=UPI00083E4FEF|nr:MULTISPECIES: hypothetical protein [unclassified Methyloversatilis]AOF83097.1 hypothetical protein BSY238_644 [Methyloversatilis sp. RAC08]MBL8477427.1 hypothetical protein [Methyloversatilis sp.]MCQ9375627.1 hypothetical protein [Methyloversatilis sp. XJ19-13]MCQ9379133.1 hypothetical protein [Methyloversatilis sp. XJ19-49]